MRLLVTPWTAIRESILNLADGEFVSIIGDDDNSLIVLFVQELEYLVTGSGIGERDYFSLIERSLGDEIVTAFDGGNTNEYPRFAFVTLPVILKAAEVYCQTGTRDMKCEWVQEDEARY